MSFDFAPIVDGSQAGSGNLEILVNGGRVTSSVRALGAQRFVASFTPHEPGVHTVQITFNGATVRGTVILYVSELYRILFQTQILFYINAAI